jgi:DNA-binding MarR family transcriptional regulator
VPREDATHTQDQSRDAALQPVTASEAIRSLEALSESVRKANEFALNTLRMKSLDALALRVISRGAETQSPINPKTLGGVLRISSAAVTKLIDRLVEMGKVTRQPNPVDRRGVILVPDPAVAGDLARAYDKIDSPVFAVLNDLTDVELSAVTQFAASLASALDAETAGVRPQG